MREFQLPEENVAEYFQFMLKRHRIYLARLADVPWPWTDDPVLRNYKFTNVFRELDKVTVWIRENIREPYANHPELFFNLMMARLFNWPPTLANVGFVEEWNRDKIFKPVHRMKEAGIKFTTGAYMLTGTLGGKGTPKDIQIVDYCLDPLWKKRKLFEPKRGDTLRQAYDRIANQVPGFGNFIAYEVVTDLRHTRYLRDAEDIMTWANPGPGAHRGIRRILGIPVDTNGTLPRSPERRGRMSRWPDEEEAIAIMRYLLDESELYLPEDFPSLEMRDIEHTLCEFDKYRRVMAGGRTRARFTPPDEREEEEVFPSLVKVVR